MKENIISDDQIGRLIPPAGFSASLVALQERSGRM
jgi:hypothetical protein